MVMVMVMVNGDGDGDGDGDGGDGDGDDYVSDSADESTSSLVECSEEGADVEPVTFDFLLCIAWQIARGMV